MALSGGQAITDALLMLGVYDPGETPSISEQNNALTVANQMLANWYNEQFLALQVLVARQNKVGLAFVAGQVELTAPLTTAYTLAAGAYITPSYTAGSVSGGAVPQFPDLTTAQTFPQGYDLAIVLNLAVLLISQYPGVANPGPSLLQNATEALQRAVTPPGKIPVPGAVQANASPAAQPTAPAIQP